MINLLIFKNFKTFSLLFKFFSEYQKKNLFKVIMLLCFAMILEVIGIGMLVPFLISIIKKISNFQLNISESLSFIYSFNLKYLLIIIFIFYLLKPIILYGINKYTNKYIFSIRENFTAKLLGMYLHCPYSKLIDKNNEELRKNIVSTVARGSNGYIGSLLSLSSEILIILGLLIFLSFVNFYALVTSLLIFFLIIYFFLMIFRNKLKKYGNEIEKLEENLFSILNYSLASIKELKIFKMHEKINNIFEIPNKNSNFIRANQATIFIIPRLLFETVFVFIIFGVFLTVIFFGKNNLYFLTIAGTFGLAFLRILPSINRTFNAYNTLIYTKAAADILIKELTAENERSLKFDKISIGELNRFIDINLHSLKTNKTILKISEFSFEKNKLTCIFGKSGSGKTTLLDIISGLLEANYKLNIDAKFINNTFQWEDVSYLGQNHFFIDSTIKENICLYSKKKFDQLKFNDALKFACLGDFVDKQKNKENTLIGYKGIKVSGGELQRIALARVYYASNNFMLLDEPTSSLDKKTEDEIIKNIEKLKGFKTIIISSHQLNFKRIADKFVEI